MARKHTRKHAAAQHRPHAAAAATFIGRAHADTPFDRRAELAYRHVEGRGLGDFLLAPTRAISAGISAWDKFKDGHPLDAAQSMYDNLKGIASTLSS